MNEPVTLLIPNYNGARYLGETIAALLRQTYRDFQLLVVDNVSTDSSVAIVRGFADARVQLVEATEHVPVGASFKRARALVETPYFATCAADEVYEPGWLEAMMNLLEAHPDAFFACSKADSADSAGRVYLAGAERYKDTFWPPEEPCTFTRERHLAALMRGNFLLITLGVFRRSATEKIGPLDETCTFTGDWQYWARGLMAGFTIVGTHQRLAHYRRHPQMTTRHLTADLSRFRDEINLIEWIARVGHEHGFLDTATPNYDLVRNTLLSEYAARLAAGDRESTARLLAFAREKIPGFRGSRYDLLARTAGVMGRPGGWSLRAAEAVYLRLLALGR